jgi:hypothetical protein
MNLSSGETFPHCLGILSLITVPGSAQVLRINCLGLGPNKGKQEIANFFAEVERTLEFSEFAPREMIEQGDTVVVLGTLRVGPRRPASPSRTNGLMFSNSVRERLVFFQEYIDTAADVLAMS